MSSDASSGSLTTADLNHSEDLRRIVGEVATTCASFLRARDVRLNPDRDMSIAELVGVAKNGIQMSWILRDVALSTHFAGRIPDKDARDKFTLDVARKARIRVAAHSPTELAWWDLLDEVLPAPWPSVLEVQAALIRAEQLTPHIAPAPESYVQLTFDIYRYSEFLYRHGYNLEVWEARYLVFLRMLPAIPSRPIERRLEAIRQVRLYACDPDHPAWSALLDDIYPVD